MPMKDYCVHARLKFPSVSWSGRDFQVSATNKKEAISRARARARAECEFTRQDGPVIYTAEEVSE